MRRTQVLAAIVLLASSTVAAYPWEGSDSESVAEVTIPSGVLSPGISEADVEFGELKEQLDIPATHLRFLVPPVGPVLLKLFVGSTEDFYGKGALKIRDANGKTLTFAVPAHPDPSAEEERPAHLWLGPVDHLKQSRAFQDFWKEVADEDDTLLPPATRLSFHPPMDCRDLLSESFTLAAPEDAAQARELLVCAARGASVLGLGGHALRRRGFKEGDSLQIGAGLYGWAPTLDRHAVAFLDPLQEASDRALALYELFGQLGQEASPEPPPEDAMEPTLLTPGNLWHVLGWLGVLVGIEISVVAGILLRRRSRFFLLLPVLVVTPLSIWLWTPWLSPFDVKTSLVAKAWTDGQGVGVEELWLSASGSRHDLKATLPFESAELVRFDATSEGEVELDEVRHALTVKTTLLRQGDELALTVRRPVTEPGLSLECRGAQLWLVNASDFAWGRTALHFENTVTVLEKVSPHAQLAVKPGESVAGFPLADTWESVFANSAHKGLLSKSYLIVSSRTIVPGLVTTLTGNAPGAAEGEHFQLTVDALASCR